ncbi:hypothetical protein CcCBS67573_g05561 [Chytriomyces confervae]|uniref:Uncharacterized protein n=1 Tax=Chytriomyces confervae TaxID=246404 RepID=A0A507FAJ9_9FUNG|nr:hypothetical protein CcCBS67573_g05561 [Chytriomyces confervae]
MQLGQPLEAAIMAADTDRTGLVQLATVAEPLRHSVTAPAIVKDSIRLVSRCFAMTRVHPHRLVYCLAGMLFSPMAPFPFGGSKVAPGFAHFTGETTSHLLHFIVNGAYSAHWLKRGMDALILLVNTVNTIIDMQRVSASKDELDEWMLKGIKRAGHIEWVGAAPPIPRYLRHRTFKFGRENMTLEMREVEQFESDVSSSDDEDSEDRWRNLTTIAFTPART